MPASVAGSCSRHSWVARSVDEHPLGRKDGSDRCRLLPADCYLDVRLEATAPVGAPPGPRHGTAQGREMSGLLSSSMLTSLKVTTRTERTKRLER
ncbi:hypothetical protein GCM10009625_12580 [Brachybacterium fresconis]